MYKLIISIGIVLSLAMPVYSQEESCEKVRQDLERKKLEVSAYSDSVQKLMSTGDVATATILNKKIDENLHLIMQLEDRLTKCPDSRVLTGSAPSTSPIKSDESNYQSRDCGELRKTLLKLLRKKHSLNKRSHSVLSELTPEEESALRATEQQLKEIRTILKQRCVQDKTPGFLKSQKRNQ